MKRLIIVTRKEKLDAIKEEIRRLKEEQQAAVGADAHIRPDSAKDDDPIDIPL